VTAAVLVGNRGEVALRIQRAARGLGLRAVAVYAADDQFSAHVTEADAAVPLDGTGPAAYLDIGAIVDAAVTAGCELVHPGYGFLSENPELARCCADRGLRFVGPSAGALALLGDKVATRALAQRLAVPVLPASAVVEDAADAQRFFDRLGPGAAVMVKAAAGGGGRGMRVVTERSDLLAALDRARSEASRAFGRPEVYLEQYLPRARHIEVQLAGDGQRTVSLGLRDCSVQHRHQKVVEIAPSAGLPAGLADELAAHATRLAAAAGAAGLVTVEFLLDVDHGLAPAFIEANPRLQVEHGITEAVTGIDLVGVQLRLAQGATLASLGLSRPPGQTGVAIEARVTHAAQPGADLIDEFAVPSGPGIRVDTHARAGYRLPAGYDPLLAKVIVHDENAAAAARALQGALRRFRVGGVRTNLDQLREVLAVPQLSTGDLTTAWWDSHFGPTPAGPGQPSAVAAAMAGTVIQLLAGPGDVVRRGQPLAVLEAMKMEQEVKAPLAGTVHSVEVTVGQVVREGAILVRLHETAGDETETEPDVPVPPRRDLQDNRERHHRGSDEARSEAVARRHAAGKRTARENVADLCQDGTFREYGPLVIAAQRTRRPVEELELQTPADGVIAGFGTLRGQFSPAVAVLAYDYTVLAGTQGLQSHKKAERIFEVARRRRTPLVVFAEGGGGRPGDVDNQAKATGMDLATFVALGRLNGVVPTAAVVSGRCFAGNAALAGACDLLVATRDANLGMGGPAMIEGGGLGRFRAEEIGPVDVQSRNGVVDVVVEDEAQATDVARRFLGYFAGPAPAWSCADQDALRAVVPEARRRTFDIRHLIELLCDTGSVLELRREFGPGIVTALVRVEGRPAGLVANDGACLGGAIDSAAADKMTRFLQLCDAHGLPVVSLCDTPGFLVGPKAEEEGMVRHVSRLFVTGPNLGVPLCMIIIRKAYGMGGQAMAGGGFRVPDAIVAWPTGELGAMGPEGAVRLGFRRELEQISDPEERSQRYEALVEEYIAAGRAVNAASVFELDDVIDPAETRSWIVQAIDAYDWSARPAGPRRIDTW
jgi:acetyl/propionyl-CoA carboxylase alpha subunit/acetyl-CoA carboxylase carboxyltransferase component